MAAQSITFDFLTTGADRTASGFRKVADNTVLAAKGAKVLANVVETLGQKENRTAAESKILASALRQTGEAADRTTARIVLADAAIRRLDDAMKDSAKSSQQLRKALGDMKLNPGLLGPALLLAPAMTTLAGAAAAAGVALGGAFIAGGAALAAFGAVAGPVLADAKKAATAAETAQTAHAAAVAKVAGQYQYAMSVAKTKAQRDAAYAAEQKGFSAAGLTQTAALSKAYEGMSPQQVALSRQLGKMAGGWDKVKKAQTPVIAGALQPWLKTVTDLTGHLGPVIAAVAPVIRQIGAQFDILVNSSAFSTFVKFIAGTGSQALAAGGNLITGLLDAFITLLPKFNPLMKQANGWVSGLGDSVAHWANSQKTADQITAFMAWFKQNGPVVGGLLKNIGGALAALAPGLASGGAAEIKIISDFLGLVAKLPPAVAKPLAEVAGAALILSKMGVLKVGLQVVGPAVKWLSGGLINIGGGATAAGAMRAAFETGGTSAAGKMVAALETGGATAAGEEGVALAGAGAGAGKAASGSFLTALAAAPGLPLIGGIIAGELIKTVGDSLNKPGSTGAAAAAGFKRTGAPGATITGGWVGALAAFLGIGGSQKPASAGPAAAGRFGIGGPSGADQWRSAMKAATAAVAAATAAITGDFGRQQKAAAAARGDVDTYTASIQANGVNSLATRFARSQLITDLVAAGVKSSVAQHDVDVYTTAVQKNGAQSDQARGARQRLITDILSASGNARKGRADMDTYTTAVRDHGVKSDQARSARQRLITDLVNSGTDAKTAAGLVDGLGTSIKNLPGGKTITITEKGLGKFAISQLMTAANNPAFGITGRKAAGGRIGGHGGPRADNQLIAASTGEFVHQATAVSKYGIPAMEAVNAGRAVIGYAAGGVVPDYRGSIGGLGPWTVRADETFTATMISAMEKAMTAAEKQAAAAGSSIPGGGGGAARWSSQILTALAMLNQPGSLLGAVEHRMNQESGGNPFAINKTDSNWLAGTPSVGAMQVIGPTYQRWSAPGWRNLPPMAYGTSEDVLANTYAGLHYALGAYPGRSLASVMLQPGGYAAGGLVGQQGAAWLKAWQTRHGGGFGAAWGPTAVNQQIPEMAAAVKRARALAGAPGLSPGQHRFWAGAAADETRRLAVLGRELTTERAWRTQLGIGELGLDAQIRAAGNLPSLAGPVRGWKAQLGRDKATVAAISRMLGYSDAYIRAHPPAPVLPKITHSYGGDIANNLGAVLASALGPFTGARAGALVMDTGGTLRPGWQSVYNGTGRPESLVPARGGGGIHLHLTVNAPIGSQQQLEDWFIRVANKTAQHGRLSQAVRAASR